MLIFYKPRSAALTKYSNENPKQITVMQHYTSCTVVIWIPIIHIFNAERNK